MYLIAQENFENLVVQFCNCVLRDVVAKGSPSGEPSTSVHFELFSNIFIFMESLILAQDERWRRA